MAGKFPSVEACKVANVDATLAAAKNFAETVVPKLANGKRFRFVLCSGMGAEWDQNKTLWFLNDTRKIKVCLYVLRSFPPFAEKGLGHIHMACTHVLWDDMSACNGRV